MKSFEGEKYQMFHGKTLRLSYNCEAAKAEKLFSQPFHVDGTQTTALKDNA